VLLGGRTLVLLLKEYFCSNKREREHEIKGNNSVQRIQNGKRNSFQNEEIVAEAEGGGNNG
jgi:hypothetical protein